MQHQPNPQSLVSRLTMPFALALLFTSVPSSAATMVKPPAAMPAAAPAAAAAEAVALRTIKSSLTLLASTESAADQLVQRAEALGGYFAQRDDARVVLRIPAPKVDGFKAKLLELGKILAEDDETEDVTANRAQLAAGLASRQLMLTRYLANLDSTKDRADLGQLITATGDLIGEIEQAKGRLRLLDHNVAYAAVDIALQARARAVLRPDTRQSFGWLSGVDVESLLADFGYGEDNP